MSTMASPVPASERIQSLDVLRGFALLGILIMNIQSFSMVGSAYNNPSSYGDLTGVNQWVWMLSHIFADMKFMALFSMLFGAGIILITNRARESTISPVALHYRRTFWLFVIGVTHAYLLWYGDILVPYALCAIVVVLFRNLQPRTLLIVGLLTVSVASMLYIFSGLSMPNWPDEAVANTRAGWAPPAEKIAEELATYRGGWLDQMAHRVPTAMMFETFIFLILFSWRAGGLMLVGMALYKWGIFSAEKSNAFYRNMMLAGYGIGIPVIVFGITKNFAAGWSLEYSMFFGSQFNYWGSLFVAAGHIGLIMLFAKSKALPALKNWFAGIGRTALSNYLLQTLICTTVFYGHGLGLFGELERFWQILIVFDIWIIQIILTQVWLKRYRMGPAEWLWRSLTYWKRQPLRI